MRTALLATPLLFASAPGALCQWSTESLSAPRGAIAAAAHGRYAVFAGGGDPASSDVVDVYDGQTGTWSRTTLTHAVQGASAVVAGDEILIAGGSADARVNVFDTRAGTWSTMTLSLGRNGLSAATVGSKALFAGGTGTAVVDIYDAQTSTWSTADLSLARSNARAVTVGSRVLFAGGIAGGITDVVDIYDDSAATWTTTTLSLPSVPRVAAAGPFAVFAHPTGDVDIYDSMSDSWSTTVLPNPRPAISVGSIGSKVFFAGGDDGFNPVDLVDILDVRTGVWGSATLSEARWSPVMVRSGTKLIIAGGDLGGSFPGGSGAVDVYDAYSDTWTSTTLAQGRVDMAAAMLDGATFFAGGPTFCCCTFCDFTEIVDVFTDVGSPYCFAVPSSLGVPAEIAASGSAAVTDNDLGLLVTDLPANQFGYVIASLTQGFIPCPGGSKGNLCLAGSIARFTGQVANSGPSGVLSVQVDLTSIPLTPPHAVVAGETWNFQCWFRDANPSQTSNFTNGVSVVFR